MFHNHPMIVPNAMDNGKERKNMKRFMAMILALMLIASLATTALAEYYGTAYVCTDKAKVYKEADKDSKVIKTLKGGTAVFVDDVVDNEKWARVLIEDTKHGGQKAGYIQTKYLSVDIPSDYCKHDWGKWKVTKEATCVKKGKRTRTCKTCGEKETEEFYADHEFGSWSITKQPTCTETGKREHTCKVCGKTESQTLDKLPHDYEWKVLVETTDHSSGTRAKVCVNCGYETGEESFDPEGTLRRSARGDEVREVQQLLVDQGYLNAGGADGIFGGGTEKALIQFQTDQGLEADGIAWPQTIKRLHHDFGPWTTVKEMTRTEAGERVRVCVDCGYEQHETIEPGTVFEKGRRGEDIRALQQIIKQVGYDAGGFDGIYGGKLDAAMASFAEAKGLVVEEGKIRPADVDAVVDAWLENFPAENWKGEGSPDSAVNLALTVTAAGEADDSGIVNYTWSLTNMGATSANYTALLLSFGDEPDFRDENLVMQLDGVTMKKNSGNSISGSFSADDDWGTGNLNFAAVAVDDKTGDLWLSNVVTFENSATPSVKTVAPQTVEIDVNALPDGIYPVSFDPGDVLGGASGIFLNAVKIYSEDIYDIVEVNTLMPGDTIVVNGDEIPVESVTSDEFGHVIVNGGLDSENGTVLAPLGEDSNGYRVFGEDDMPTYTLLGTTTLRLADTAVLNDSWKIDADPITAAYGDIVSTITGSENAFFVQYNTTVRIENGAVVEINRIYVP